MKLNTRPGTRRHRPAFRRTRPTQQVERVISLPTQAAASELSEAYTWAVNAAVESDRPELAYELALSFAREA